MRISGRGAPSVISLVVVAINVIPKQFWETKIEKRMGSCSDMCIRIIKNSDETKSLIAVFYEKFDYSPFSICSCTIASTTATVVRFKISRVELSTSVKWIGLFKPIWIGPIVSLIPSVSSNL